MLHKMKSPFHRHTKHVMMQPLIESYQCIPTIDTHGLE